jgi:hypothetical protein
VGCSVNNSQPKDLDPRALIGYPPSATSLQRGHGADPPLFPLPTARCPLLLPPCPRPPDPGLRVDNPTQSIPDLTKRVG